MNILITSASRKVSLVKYFQGALKQEGGGKVITVDTGPLCAALFQSDLSYLIPRDSEPSFMPTILKLCKKYEIKLLIPTRDEELKIFAKNKEKFEEVGTKVMVAKPEVIEICSDKLKFTRFCERNDIPVPKTYTKKEINESLLGFPLFIKERYGKGSRNTFKIKNKKELEFFLGYVKNPIVQEYIKGKEYTIDLFADFDGRIISVVPRERIYLFGGESLISRIDKNEKLIKAASGLAKKIGLVGHNNIQCFSDGNEVKFIEINPRYGGASSLSFAAGANTPLYLIQLVKGKKVKSKIGKFKDGLITVRYFKDIFINNDEVKKLEKFGQGYNF